MSATGAVARLVAMRDDELAAWLPRALAEYVEDRVRAGETLVEATAIATAQHDANFPDGSPALGHTVFNVVVDDVTVGVLWLGPAFAPQARASRYVFNVEVHEVNRGRGYGRAAMRAAEEWTRAQGASRLCLNVFGFNAPARSLYDSLGYQIGSTFYGKELC